jgi:hypothetical protein
MKKNHNYSSYKGLVIFMLFYFNFAPMTSMLSQTDPKPRIIITADPEMDDNNSLLRLLLYSTDVNIEGLVYASSQFHWKGDGKGTKWFVAGREYDRFNMGVCPCESWRWAKDEKFIHNAVEAYAKVYPNLKIHNKEYPAPDYLRSVIRYGNIEFDGDFSKDTPGSLLIKNTLMDNKQEKLFVTVWGGASTLSRALKSIEDQNKYSVQWPDIQKKISNKLVILLSGDQDDTYAHYIKPTWPNVETRQFSQGPNFGYNATIKADPVNMAYMTPEWMEKNITSVGPLGKLYSVWGDGKQMVKGDKVDYFGLSGYTADELRKMGYYVWMPPQPKGTWLSEGDNPTFMNMLDNGLKSYEKGYYGGWGGSIVKFNSESNPFAATTNSEQMANQMTASNKEPKDDPIPFPNYFPDVQNSFAARMKWSITPQYNDANHEPKIKIIGPEIIMANKGQKIKLYSNATDPDGQKVSTRWYQTPTFYKYKVIIDDVNQANIEATIPEGIQSGQELHLIAEVTDEGTPPLKHYQRVIVVIR